jgi:lysophospholipase
VRSFNQDRAGAASYLKAAMELYGFDANPVPDGAVVGSVTTPDGVTLRYARWRAVGRRSLGTVCILQGRSETIEKYFETVVDLRKRGFAVAAFDWRGQGGSDRHLRNPAKGHVDSFAEYDRDLDAFVQQVVLPDCPPPHYALAHSMGGLLALRAAHDNRARFTRMVLIGPFVGFGPTRPSPPIACRIAASFTAAGLGELAAHGQARGTTLNTAFEDNSLTGDPARYALMREISERFPAICVGTPTYGWLYAACRACREAAEPDFAPAIKIPTLIVVGALERVVSIAAIERLASEMRTGGHLVIPGAEHELLMERDLIRDQFFAAFDAFVPGS